MLPDEEGRKIGVDCIDGKALNLTEPCRRKCNYYAEDEGNYGGVLRSHVPCNVTNMNTTQCIPEGEMRDGKFQCKNRADEEPFATGIGNSSSLLLDLDNILKPCTDQRGMDGFTCSGYLHYGEHCLPLSLWCNPNFPYTCDELADKTATEKTTDHQMCSNQTFWEGKGCNCCYYGGYMYRCTGDTPGHRH